MIMSTTNNTTSIACCTTSAPTSLPAEIVLDCLESLVHHISESDSFTEAYASLSNCSQVSRLWQGPAQKVLLSNVELVRKDQAVSLFNTLRLQRKGDSVRNLVVGVGKTELGQHMIDASFLGDLLNTCPNARKLTLLHHDLPDLPSSSIPDLHQLNDVTIAASGWKSAPGIEIDFLRTQRNVRFLQLPCPEFSKSLPTDIEMTPPAFQLFSLSTQQYPSPTAQWALQNSSPTLQCMTVAYMGDLALTAQNHPQLRSLRILTRISQTRESTGPEGLAAFPFLERLEVRDISIKLPFLRSLPTSIQYLRIWSTDLARELITMLSTDNDEEAALPNLRTIVWDWHCPTGGSDDDVVAAQVADVVNGLLRVCQSTGIELRLFKRKDGRRASQGKDLTFEADLRASCYRAFNLRPIPIFDDAPTKLPARVFKDMHSLGLPLAAHFKSISPFMDSTPGLWSPIFEDCFEGHGDWLERHLPALQAKTMRRSLDGASPRSPSPRLLPGSRVPSPTISRQASHRS